MEIGGHFTLLDVNQFSGRVNEPGIGARITFNPAPLLGLEGEMNFFPKRGNGVINQEGGRITQGLFGAKLGLRTEKFGVFGKIRPGFQSFGQVLIEPTNSIDFEFSRVTHFALDAGGVLEFYPSRRTLLRFDIGDTIVRYGSQTYNSGSASLTIPIRFRHNLQLSVGAGIRF